MAEYTRRKFLHSSAALLGAVIVGPSFTNRKTAPKLSFSSLGCPGWSFEQIVDFAAANGYAGIELRGIQKELELEKCKEFSSAANITATLNLMKQKGLQFVDLGSSCNLHIAEAAERKKNLDEAKRFIDLAEQTGCPYVRVFPNSLPKDGDKKAAMDLIAKGLMELGDYAKNTRVIVLMETHGDLVHADDIVYVMQQAAQPHTGLVWDIANMWTVTKEPPAKVYNKLKKHIRHTHIKDAKLSAHGKIEYKLLGQGEVPIFEAIDILYNDGYSGYYSFEWEKLWHPEILEPEIALADYPKAMAQHFGKK
jgi:sugar phosphate isomerase/epimerase